MNYLKIIYSLQIITLIFISITAVWGGLGLILTGGSTFELEPELLRLSPFSSYLIPGLILLAVVGGTNALALWLLIKRNNYAAESIATAGFGLLIWVFAELFMLPDHHWVQIVYFMLALLLLISTMLSLRLAGRRIT